MVPSLSPASASMDMTNSRSASRSRISASLPAPSALVITAIAQPVQQDRDAARLDEHRDMGQRGLKAPRQQDPDPVADRIATADTQIRQRIGKLVRAVPQIQKAVFPAVALRIDLDQRQRLGLDIRRHGMFDAVTTWRIPMRLGILIAVLLAGPAAAYDQLVEKQEFTLQNYQTRNGETVPEMRLGYET